MDNGGWYTRKRKASSSSDGATTTTADNDTSAIAAAKKLSDESTDNSNIPKSLLPYLGWTKLTACHTRPRKKRRVDTTWDRDEGLQKVTGRAVFFIHDPRPGDSDDKDESKIWFQGRFFPSIGGSTNANNARGAKKSISPTSVLSSSQHDAAATPNFRMDNSWGLLATQNVVVDECLTCSEGGYRELDITFIQQKKKQSSNYASMRSNNGSSNNKKKVRWVSQDVVWTGGNMMMLSTEPYTSTTTSISTDKPGMKFDTHKLMEGEKAIEVATKYFPSMVKRLQIHNVTNDNDDESSDKMMDDAMILIGDMEVVAPVSFVNCNRRVGFAHRLGSRDDSSDDDGLWND